MNALQTVHKKKEGDEYIAFRYVDIVPITHITKGNYIHPHHLSSCELSEDNLFCKITTSKSMIPRLYMERRVLLFR